MGVEKLQKICLKLIALIGIVIFGYLTFHAWTSSGRLYISSEAVVQSEDHIWINLLFIAVVLLIFAGISALVDKISDRTLYGAAVIVSFAVTACCCILAAAAHTYPDADQIYVYEVAENFFSGDYTNIQTEWYFNNYPYQLGIGLLFGIIMRVSGSDSYLVIHYTQAVCTGVVVYALFRITRELFQSKKASAIVLMCAAFFAPMYLYSIFLYGETLGVCFALLGMLFWLKANSTGSHKKKIRVLYWILAALCLTICYIARTALVIVLIAMIITGFLQALTDKRWYSFVLTLFLFVVVIALQKFSVAYVEKKAGVDLADGEPAILVIAMSMQDEDPNGTGPGSYNAYSIWLYFECGFDGKEASEKAFFNLKQTLYRWSRDPLHMINYMNRKVLNQWNEATYGGFFMTARQQEPEAWVEEIYSGETGDRIYAFLNLYQGMLYAILLLYFIQLFREKREIVHYLPALLLIGEFCFSLLWEAKSRYVYPYIVLTLSCAAWSLTYCTGKVTGGIRKWRKETP